MLKNDVKDKWGYLEGVYTFQGFSDGMDYWVDAEGENAIWYLASGSTYYWLIGYLSNLGNFVAASWIRLASKHDLDISVNGLDSIKTDVEKLVILNKYSGT